MLMSISSFAQRGLSSLEQGNSVLDANNTIMNSPGQIFWQLYQKSPDEKITLLRANKDKDYIHWLEVSAPESMTPEKLKSRLQEAGITMDFTVIRNASGNIEIDFGNAKPSVFEVEQGKYKISEQTLITAGLETCTALGFSVNGTNFLTHIDAVTNTWPIVSSIKIWFTEEELKNAVFYIWEGMSLMSDAGTGFSREKVDGILLEIGAKPDNIISKKVSFMNRIVIGNNQVSDSLD